MLRPGFEWMVAWRHLRDPGKRTHWTLITGVCLLAFGAICFGGEAILTHVRPRGLIFIRGAVFFENLKMIGSVAAGIGWLALILGLLFEWFTVFTAISIFGVFLGTGQPIVALSVMSGFELDLKSKIRATKADIVIERADDQPFSDWTAVQKRITGVPGVVDSMAYIESEVIVKHISNPAGMGIVLRGIDPVRAPHVLDLPKTLKEGRVDDLIHPERIRPERQMPLPPDGQEGGTNDSQDPDAPAAAAAAGLNAGGDATAAPDVAAAGEGGRAVGGHHAAPAPATGKAQAEAEDQDGLPVPAAGYGAGGVVPPGILLGEELFSHTLRVFVGSDVDVACPQCGFGPTGPMPKLRTFRVAGHFYSGMYEFDSKLAYVSLKDAQKFLGMRDEVSGVEVRTTNPDKAGEIAARISALLGGKYEVRSWEELNRGLFMALKLEKLAMFIVLTFIALVASFSIVSNLIMLVTEKGREVAILKSMGATDGAILRIFFAEGLYIGLLGLATGLVQGIGSCLLLARFGLPLDRDVYYISKLPVVMRFSEISSVGLAALALCCLATVYPAYLASRMRPVEGLRYE